MKKTIQELKGYEKIKELINDEIEEYSYFEAGELKWNNNYDDYDLEDEEEHYQIEIGVGVGDEKKKKILYFNYNKETEKIEIDLYEDNWHEVCSYDWKIKYFWMALLKW